VRFGSDNLDHTVWLWNVTNPAQPAPLATLEAQDANMFTAAFAPTGSLLAASGAGSDIHLWITDPNQAAERVCATAGDPITRAEWTQFITGTPYNPPC
jgi:WD40 repeat protein